MAGGHVYILGNLTVTLYIGVTSNLYVRVMQHKEGTLEGFTAGDAKRSSTYRTINPEFKDPAQT